VLPFVRWRVDLDPVVEAEEAQSAGRLPDERIKGGEKGPGREASRQASVAMQIGEPSPPRDLDRLQDARLDEGLYGGLGLIRAETKIVAQLQRGGDAPPPLPPASPGCRIDLGPAASTREKAGR
jgi:hypothetical protein